jgi:hypothetical protein
MESASFSTNQERGSRFDKRELKYLMVLLGPCGGVYFSFDQQQQQVLFFNTENYYKLFQKLQTPVHLQICLTRTLPLLSHTLTLLLELSSLLSVPSLETRAMWYVHILLSSSSSVYFIHPNHFANALSRTPANRRKTWDTPRKTFPTQPPSCQASQHPPLALSPKTTQTVKRVPGTKPSDLQRRLSET